MLKILMEIIVQVFDDNNTFWTFVVFLFFGLIVIGLINRFNGLILRLRLSTSEKSLCARLCFEGYGDLITSY